MSTPSPLRRPHPDFDDRGTLDWHTRWAEAAAAAQASGKLIFVDMGRELCSQCRTLVQSVVPHPQVAPLLERHFVALASDCDDAEDQVIALAEQLPDATMLPFVMIAAPDGRLLGGHSGAIDAKRALQLLEAHAPKS